MRKIEETREILNKVKPKSWRDIKDDMSNVEDILNEYDTISKVGKDLVNIRGQNLSEALATQPTEYAFFRRCVSNLKGIVEFMDALVKHNRGIKYQNIRTTESKSNDINDRAINSIIDGDPDILEVTFKYLLVKEMYERFQGILESYHQRGYALNNIVKVLIDAAALEYLIQ